jgi:hypothetical protein
MNFERDLSPDQVLDNIMELLDVDRMAIEIDEPLNQAAQSFQQEVPVPITHPAFNQVVSAFARHVYSCGLRLPRNLSGEEALSEAIHILNKYYEGVNTWGYDGALLDATSANLEGLELVLFRLAESLKELERTKYVEWVFASNLYPLEWEMHHQVVFAFLKRNREFLPAELQDIDPARIIDHLPVLVSNHVSTERTVRQISERNNTVFEAMLEVIEQSR